TGGAGRDVFVFSRGGQDRVTDFGRGDKLEFARADGFGELRIRDRGDDALVIHGRMRALLEDVDADALGRNDFVF
ncbi:MAG: calcium-binding protein, partial [Pseudomonadota bacterium]